MSTRRRPSMWGDRWTASEAQQDLRQICVRISVETAQNQSRVSPGFVTQRSICQAFSAYPGGVYACDLASSQAGRRGFESLRPLSYLR